MAVRGTTLGRVIRTAATQGRSAATDRDLLRRFAEDGDQEAFETLVRRHTGLVIGVCRRALTNAQDAEDACQATFLVLARKAGDWSWQPSIVNWLFATARKVASNLRREAERRARRESRAAVPEAVEPIDRMTGRELLAAVDEELDRLPPVYREALLLLFQEELSREEIAARLGIPAGTVKIRLERGRKKLADALARRGVALGAGLLVLLATSRAGAFPPRLVEGIRAVVAGKVPPTVAALAEGVAVNGFAKKLVLVALVAVTAIGLGVGPPLAITAGSQPEKAPLAKAAENKGAPPDKTKAEEGERTITGRVVGLDSKPVAGAELLLQRPDGAAKKLGVSGADGRFTVTAPRGEKQANLVAKADGAGVEFVALGGVGPMGEVELRLAKDRPIRGRVVNTDGKPVAGLKVFVKHVGVYGNILDSFLADWKTRHPADGLAFGTKHLSLSDAALLPVAITDAQGRFAVAGVGDGRLVELRIRGDGVADHDLWVVNREGFDPKPYNQAMLDQITRDTVGLEPAIVLSGPEPAVVVEPDKPIRGVVRDKDTGKPRAGVVVVLARNGLERGSLVRRPRLSTTTDAEGRYELRGARKAKGYLVKVSADPTTGHVAAEVRGEDTDGYAPLTIDIEVKKGVIVTGRVIDKSTGKPLPGWASVSVLHDNTFVKDYPKFGQDWFASGATGPDGTFRCVTLPGPVLLTGAPDAGRLPDGDTAWYRYKPAQPDPNYPDYFVKFQGFYSVDTVGTGLQPLHGNFAKVLDIKPGADTVTHDVVVELATALPVKIQGPDGKPVTGCWVTGLGPEDWHPPTEVKGDSCAAYHLEGRPRLMVFHEPAKKLFGNLALKGDEKEPVTVRLGPGGAVKGRLLGEDGKPLVGVAVSIYHPEREAEELRGHVHRLRPVATDADGTFELEDVIPGVKFRLSFRRGKTAFQPLTKGAAARTAEAGQTTDVGELKLKVPGPGGGE